MVLYDDVSLRAGRGGGVLPLVLRPTNRAFATLNTAGSLALRNELEALWSGINLAKDGSTHVEAEQLHITVIRA